jgi:hypothetical protein
MKQTLFKINIEFKNHFSWLVVGSRRLQSASIIGQYFNIFSAINNTKDTAKYSALARIYMKNLN